MDNNKFIKTRVRRFPFQGLSIQQRLPLLICVLLLCVIITFGWISYIGVKDATLQTGKERLRSVTDQLSSMLAQSAQNLIAGTRASANQETIKVFLQTGAEEAKTEALQTLQKIRTDTTTWAIAGLLDKNRQTVLRSAKESLLIKGNFDSLLSVSFRGDSAASIGKIFKVGDAMYYPTIVPITDDNKQVLGYLARWRMVATTPATIEQFSKFIGTKASLYVGNKDKSLWTDMIKPLPDPIPSHAKLAHNIFEYSGDDGKKLSSSKAIANTPWVVLVEFSEKNVIEAANRFLAWILIAGAVLIGIGILVAWIMSRNITRPLNKLTAATSAIASGDYSATVAMERRDEVGKLARAFNAMIGQVNKARHGLEQKIMETSDMNEQLRGLSAYLQNVREDERIHIAREMHDELGQLLTGFKMDASWLRKKLTENNDPAIREKLENMLTVIDEAVKFVRNLASELRPSILDDLGLIPALEWHSHEFEKRYNIKVNFQSQVPSLSMSSVVATGLFRMYQESLTNVARHSDAKKVVASLRIVHNELSLTITDDGKGFDTSQVNKKTLGLLGMKERAAMIGGKLEILSEPGKGTTVLITVKHLLVEKVAVGY